MAFFTPFAYREQKDLGPAPIVYDQDAINFFNATGITDTGLKDAVDTFVVALKNTGSLWTDLVQICPLVADDTSSLATQFAVNLRDTGSYNLTFPNGVGALSDLNGFFANETNTIYANTNLAPRTVFGSLGDYSVGVHTTTTGETGDAWDWGGLTSNSDYSFLITGRSLSGGNTNKLFAGRPDLVSNITTAAAAGFFNGRYNSGITPNQLYYINGTQVDSRSGGTGNILSLSAFLGSSNNNGTPSSKCDKQYQMLVVGNGLTSTQMVSLNTIVQNFQTDVDAALGTTRSV